MKKEELQEVIKAGLVIPARYLKRSAWMNVERVMEYLVKKGLVVRKDGGIKYAKKDPSITMEQMVETYYKSPLVEHVDEIRRLSADLHLPLNSGALLTAFNSYKI